jgi:hypothetical protein
MAWIYTVDGKISPKRYHIKQSKYCENCNLDTCKTCSEALSAIKPAINSVSSNVPYFAIHSKWEDLYTENRLCDKKEVKKMKYNKNNLRMPYGKFKGELITELPSPYLRWIAENWKEDTELNKRICSEADTEYQEREKHNTHHFYE